MMHQRDLIEAIVGLLIALPSGFQREWLFTNLARLDITPAEFRLWFVWVPAED